VPVLHVPHEPPQPSPPHARPSHEGVQVAAHVPLFVLHVSPFLQLPQVPPQPSLPQAFFEQCGTHAGASGICGSPGSTGSVGSIPASGESLWTVVDEHAASDRRATTHERKKARKGR
jgi:hypothetical protein